MQAAKILRKLFMNVFTSEDTWRTSVVCVDYSAGWDRKRKLLQERSRLGWQCTCHHASLCLRITHACECMSKSFNAWQHILEAKSAVMNIVVRRKKQLPRRSRCSGRQCVQNYIDLRKYSHSCSKLTVSIFIYIYIFIWLKDVKRFGGIARVEFFHSCWRRKKRLQESRRWSRMVSTHIFHVGLENDVRIWLRCWLAPSIWFDCPLDKRKLTARSFKISFWVHALLFWIYSTGLAFQLAASWVCVTWVLWGCWTKSVRHVCEGRRSSCKKEAGLLSKCSLVWQKLSQEKRINQQLWFRKKRQLQDRKRLLRMQAAKILRKLFMNEFTSEDTWRTSVVCVDYSAGWDRKRKLLQERSRLGSAMHMSSC